jgi:lipopolysaccharide transport system ATP-binding protein
VEQFLDTPVKRYSSGMYVRLAFALAVHLDVDVLLVDEVLAVGDQEFQQRSLSKMRSVATDGRTVLLVSHQLNTVAALCDAALYLKDGRVVEHAPASTAIARYLADSGGSDTATDLADASRRPGSGEVRMVALEQQRSDGVLALAWRLRCARATERVFVSFHVVDDKGLVVLQCDSRLVHPDFAVTEGLDAGGVFEVLGPRLKPGRYRVDASWGARAACSTRSRTRCASPSRRCCPTRRRHRPTRAANGTVLADFRYAGAP